MTEPVNSAGEQRGRPFKKGQSGNPAGKPKGLRNKRTLDLEALLDGEAQAITRKAVEMAKAGDTVAMLVERCRSLALLGHARMTI